jgi:lysophospholipase L1-like esterase
MLALVGWVRYLDFIQSYRFDPEEPAHSQQRVNAVLSHSTKKLLGFALLAAQVVLLALSLSLWWAQRTNTLFNNGRWIVGKDTGKYVFCAHDYMFAPITEKRLCLTSHMGFQEVLFRDPENEQRQLTEISFRAKLVEGAYLYVEMRKQNQGMVACRISRNKWLPGAFLSYADDGSLISKKEHEAPILREKPTSYRVRMALEEDSWQLYVDGKQVNNLPNDFRAGGHFGFRGSGWNRRPASISCVYMKFQDPTNPGKEWTETESFSNSCDMARTFPASAGIALLFIMARILRRRMIARHLNPVRMAWLRLVDDGTFAGLLLLSLFIPGVKEGVQLPGTVLLSEAVWLGLMLVGSRDVGEKRKPALGWCAGYLFILLAALAAASFKHGAWLGRKQWQTSARRNNEQIASLIVSPDEDVSPSGYRHPGQTVVLPGGPLFVTNVVYGSQKIECSFVPRDGTTVDIVLQQQSVNTRGDPDGETLALQRRLLRLTTVDDVAEGLSLSTDNRPNPFAAISGEVAADLPNKLTIISDAAGITIDLNGKSTSLPGIRPLEPGITGIMVYDGSAVIERLAIEPLPENGLGHSEVRLAAPLLPLAAALLAWLLLFPLGRPAFATVLISETAAFFPLVFYLLASTAVDTAALSAMGRTRLAWLSISLAACALSHITIVILHRKQIRFAPLISNLCILSAGLLVLLAVWDCLPNEHPLRMKFRKEVIAPAASPASASHGPWYTDNDRIGSHTYVWSQRFGGEAIALAKPDGTTRIFVVGGSQAWGSGAASSRETFAEQIEKRLLEKGYSVEVFNAAKNGGGIAAGLDLYRGLIRQFSPDIIVADVGLNECAGLQRHKGEERVRQWKIAVGYLRSLVEECQSDGVDMVVALEPMCGETPLRPVWDFYDAMQALCVEFEIPVLRPYPDTRKREEDHFVWWDTAHFTPYGHKLMADLLFPEVEKAVSARAK